jgi:hypothetical protein
LIYFFSGFQSYQLSAISFQPSAFSHQLSAFSFQLFAISYQLSASSYLFLELIPNLLNQTSTA